MPPEFDAVGCFQKLLADNPEISSAVAAIMTLLEFMESSKAETLSGLRHSLTTVVKGIKESTGDSHTSISSGCELFIRFITLASLEQTDFNDCKTVLIDRGRLFLEKCSKSRARIASLSEQFIRDGATILTHSRSRVVLQLLKKATELKRRFNVFITESLPDQSGYRMQSDLLAAGIPSVVILDAAVGFVMERVDLVLVGAEAVVESGGIVNKVGTFQISVMAKAMSKPVYAVAESFKFLRLFPLDQNDVPNTSKYLGNDDQHHPKVDYTPPSYIALLFTDLGVLTPSAVSDELIKLYC